MKKWFESRTLWLAVAQGIVGVIVVLQAQYPEVGALVIGKSVLDIALRMATITEIE